MAGGSLAQWTRIASSIYCRQSNLLSIHVVMIDVDYLMASVFVQDIPRKDDEIVPIISEIGMITAQLLSTLRSSIG